MTTLSAPLRSLVSMSEPLDFVALATRARLRLAGDGPGFRLEPFFIRDKGADGRLVGYRVVGEDGASPLDPPYITVRLGEPGRLRSEFERFADKPAALPRWMRPGSIDEELGELYLPFPLDRRIPRLRHIARPKYASRFIESVVGGLPAGARLSRSRSRMSCVSYRPERRAVLRWDVPLRGMLDGPEGEASFHTRIHADPMLGDPEATRSWLRRHGIPCPELLASTPEGLQLERSLPGEPLTNPLQVRLAGRVVARLHSLGPAPGLANPLKGRGSERAADCVSALTKADAARGARAKRLLADLAGNPPALRPLTVVHGDCHREQFLAEREHVRLLDWDRARVGHPAEDLGSYVAHTVLSSTDWKNGWEEFSTGYASAGPLPRTEVLGWYAAIAVLHLADAPLRRCSADWRKTVDRLLDACELFSGAAGC